jgi:hypothetical protein
LRRAGLAVKAQATRRLLACFRRLETEAGGPERPHAGFDRYLLNAGQNRGIETMDNVTIIRVVAGVLFVIVLVLLIQRRRTRVK